MTDTPKSLRAEWDLIDHCPRTRELGERVLAALEGCVRERGSMGQERTRELNRQHVQVGALREVLRRIADSELGEVVPLLMDEKFAERLASVLEDTGHE